MGKAIIIPDVSFQSLGLGQVHFASDFVRITCPNVIVGESFQVICSSANVTWTVDSTTYATIDANTGVLTINQNAAAQSVKITATSKSDPLNKDEFMTKVIYSDVANATFDEVHSSSIKSILRNGSTGNPSNTMRVACGNTIDLADADGARYVMITTTRPNTAGYKYYANTAFSTLVGGSTANNSTFNGATSTTFICAMGRYGTTQNPQDAPMGTIFPLYEDTDFEYGCEQCKASGSTPVSWVVQAIQESTSSYYADVRALRLTDFDNYDVKVHYLK